MLREAILKEIKQRKLRQTDIHRLTGISKNQISKFYKGKSLHIDNLDKICKSLNLILVKLL